MRRKESCPELGEGSPLALVTHAITPLAYGGNFRWFPPPGLFSWASAFARIAAHCELHVLGSGERSRQNDIAGAHGHQFPVTRAFLLFRVG